MPTSTGKFMLIDGHSLIHRAFHALPIMTTSTGQHTNAVYGFATMLMRLLEDEKPDYAAVAFDRAAPTFRHVTYEAYKAQRAPMADELRSQIPLVRELVGTFNLAICEKDGFEADDVIGTLACKGRADGSSVVIVTGDKDALQLVEPGIMVLITRKGITEMERYDAALVEERLGVKPNQVVDLKALMGDASDNIPGVTGIGPKTAARLLQEYGTLENILAKSGEMKGKVGETLRLHQAEALLSQELAKIDTNVPVEFDRMAFMRQEPDVEQLVKLLTRLEARALIGQVERRYSQVKETSTPADTPGLDFTASPVNSDLTVSFIANEQWEPALAQLAEPLLAITASRPGEGADPALVMCAAAGGSKCVATTTDPTTAFQSLIRPGRPLVGHDLKEQLVMVARNGGCLPEPEAAAEWDDLQLASYLVNPSQGDHSFADIAVKHCCAPPAPWPPAANAAGVAEWLPPLTQRVAIMQATWPHLRQRLEQDGLMHLYRTVEMPLLVVLAHMEHTGIAIDKKRLADMSADMAGEVERLTQAIYAAAGEEFNINSPKQLASIMFEKLRLPVLKQTKTGPSTAADVLEELAAEHELPRLLLDYRQLVKLTGTYVDALPQQVHPHTGRIHTTFNLTVAATGRLSSTNPNLQNIPVRTALGRQIRSAFVPGSPGWVLISADYSQIELRVLAHLSQDPNLLAAFRAGIDIHTKTAAEVFGVDQTAVTAEMRSGAKAINFGIVYGISSFGLARGTGLPRSDAQEYIKSYFNRYPGVKQYMEQSVATARSLGYVTTVLGRRRYLPDIHSRRWPERSFAERTAMNTPIQGSAADIIKLAMLKVYKRLRDAGLRTRMLLQVHDELVFESPEEELSDAVQIIREEMENAFPLDVPLLVSVGAGPNWLDIEELPDA